MTTGQPESYKKEIFDFLRTCTIKFEPFAYCMGQAYMDKHGLGNPHGRWNPYYQNLAGEYAEGDQRMIVWAPEVEVSVPFDSDLKIQYPKAAALYRIPNKEYTMLEERYPKNIGLIKSIAYPVEDIDVAIKAPNFTLLAYDDTLLEVTERESLICTLKNFLEMVRQRWWLDEFIYEDMFAITFWGMLWQYLPVLLLTQRFINIKTSDVHSFHVWEYLKSKGLSDYRDVLSIKQSLWLYRNINWILKNKGKDTTLVELAKNLLDEVFVSLLYKDMYQNSFDLENTCKTVPQFRSYKYGTDEEIKQESFSGLNSRMVESEIEYRDSQDYITKTEKDLGEIAWNHLPTKFLEFKKDPLNTINLPLLTNFMIDTLTYRLSQKDLSYQVQLRIPLTGEKIKIYIGDAVLLWHWSLLKSVDMEPTIIPTKFYSCMAFVKDKPLVKDLTKYISWHDNKYLIRSHVDVLNIIQGNDWHPRPFVSAIDFIEHLMGQYQHVLNIKKHKEQSNKLLYHLGLRRILYDITIQDTVTIDFGIHKTYKEYYQANPDMSQIVGTYENTPDKETAYKNLARALFDVIFPIDYAKYRNLVGASRNIEAIYRSIRDLFIQLCSYNVTYLENDREERDYLQLPMYDIHEQQTWYNFDDYWNMIIPGLNIWLGTHWSNRDKVSMWIYWTRSTAFINLMGNMDINLFWNLYLNIPMEMRMNWDVQVAFFHRLGYSLAMKNRTTITERWKYNIHPGNQTLTIKE